MTKRMKYSLKLTPISGISSVIRHEKNHSDEWLDNDSSNILQNANDNANQTSPASITGTLSNSPEKRTINVEQLIITETEGGFNILESNAQTTLKDDDIINVGATCFQVSITGEAIVEYAGPQRRYDFDTLSSGQHDSWAQTIEQSDPFTTAPAITPGHSHTPTPSHDPLSFLYSGMERHTYQAPIDHHNQAPEILTNLSTMPVSRGLHIDTHSHYSPISTQGEMPQPVEPEMSNPPGNILNDLGINSAQNSTILSGRYGQSGKTLDEKSPMDMLDEYLEEPTPNLPTQMISHSPTAYPTPKPFHDDLSEDASITRSIKGMFKKLIS